MENMKVRFVHKSTFSFWNAINMKGNKEKHLAE